MKTVYAVKSTEVLPQEALNAGCTPFTTFSVFDNHEGKLTVSNDDGPEKVPFSDKRALLEATKWAEQLALMPNYTNVVLVELSRKDNAPLPNHTPRNLPFKVIKEYRDEPINFC